MLRSGKGDRAGPRVFLAAFGKHPGWDDHIEDIGIETEHLASLKQLLYVQGIGGQIDAGAWEDLPAEKRHEGFRHAFVCRSAGGVTVGRLWSSVDGKGRARYPMVVAAEGTSVPPGWFVREMFPRLEALQERCVSARTAGEVISVIDEAREEYRAALEAAGELPPHVVAPRTLAELADRPELGPQQEGLFRVLYQVEREVAPFLRGRYAPARDAEARPVQMRVPACGEAPADVLVRWLDFLLARVDPAVEVWAILPLDAPWVDLFVGRPYPQQFFCFQASRQALPLASDIPYTLDEEFLSRARQAVEASRAGTGEPMVIPAEGARRPGRALAEKVPLAETLTSIAANRTLRLAVIVAVALAVLLGLVAAAVALWPTGSAEKPPQKPPPNRVTMAPEAAAAWERLCLALDGWMARFLADLDAERLDRWRADPHLAAHVVPILEQVLEGGKKLDPRRFADLEGTTLRLAARRPPLKVRKDPRIIEHTFAALEDVRAVREALSEQAWPTRRRLAGLAGRFEALGWRPQAAYLKSVAAGVQFRPGLARAVDEVVAAGVEADRLATDWDALEKMLAVIEANGPPLMKAFRTKYVAPRLAPAPAAGARPDDLAALRERLAPVLRLARSLAEFLRPDWRDGLDMEMVAREPPVATDPAGWPADQLADGSLFERWLRGIQNEKYQLLSPKLDPRTTEWKKRQQQAFAAIEKTLAALRGEHGDPNAPRYAEQLASLRRQYAELCSLKWGRANRERIEHAAAQFARGPAGLARQVNDALLGYIGGVEKFVASLPESISQKSEVLNAAWRQRRDEITRGARSIAALRPAVGALRAGLEELDAELPAELPEVEGNRDWLRKLGGEPLVTLRESVLQSALVYLDWQDGRPVRTKKFDKAWSALREKYDLWRKDAAALVEAFTRVKAALDAGALLAEKVPPFTKPLGEVYAALQGRPAWPAAKAAGVFGEVTARLERLSAVAGASDRAALAGEAGRAVGGRFEAARAAWHRLERLTPPWPDSPAELLREHDIARALSAAYDLLNDAARRKALRAELAAGLRRRWESYLLRRTDAAECDDAVRRMGAFGIDETALASLRPPTRFRVLLHRLREAARARGAAADDAALRKAVADFLAAAGRLGPEATAPAAAGKLLAELRSVRGAAAEAGADLSRAALAAALPAGSVVVDPAADGASVKFRWLTSGGQRHTVHFVRIDPPGGTPAFLSTTEVSVGLFNDTVAARGRWREFKDLLPTYVGAMNDVRSGPHVWQMAEGGEGITAAAWWRWTPGLGEEAFYAPGLSPGPITDEHPMQHVSVQAAAYMAALLGCRLPTSAEWQQARSAGGGAPERPNLRDATWRKQKDHIASLGAKAGAVYAYPDAGAFWPASIPRAQRKVGIDAVARPEDDGVLWFAKVRAGPAGGFHHLVGNVAEFVLDDPTARADLKDPRAEGIRKMLQAHSSAVKVIGGSALSAPVIDPTRPYAPDFAEASEGYSDVGFRLAFTAPAMPLRARLLAVLNRFGYPPAAPKKPAPARPGGAN